MLQRSSWPVGLFHAGGNVIVDAHFHCDLMSSSLLQQLLEEACREGILALSAGVWPSDTCSFLDGFVNKWEEHQLFKAHAGCLPLAELAIHFSAGFHPAEIHRRLVAPAPSFAEEVSLLRACAARNPGRIRAIGETGFDLSRDVLAQAAQLGLNKQALLALQWEAFSVCLELASEWGLPLVFHCRNAWAETEKAARLAFARGLKVLFHCYPGSAESLLRLSEFDCFFSFGGVLTWENARKMKEAFQVCPIEKMLFESDAPDLPPRFTRPSSAGNGAPRVPTETFVPAENSPLYIKELIESVAWLRSEDAHVLAEACKQNLLRFLEVRP